MAACQDTTDLLEQSQQRIQDLEAQLRVLTDIRLARAGPHPDGGFNLDLVVPHWAARLLADSFAETLGDAENFTVIELHHEKHGSILVTVQKKFGSTPAAQHLEANAQLDKLSAPREGADGRILTLPERIAALAEPISNENPKD